MNIVLDPVTKLVYLEAAWEEEYIEKGKKHLKEQVSLHVAYECRDLLLTRNYFFQFLVYKTRYEASQENVTVTHDHTQQSDMRMSLIMQSMFYFD